MDRKTAAARRADYGARMQQDLGVDEAMVERLVRGFYDRVREDPTLGPIFAARISDWEPHLQRMCAFWSSVMLMTGRYHGRPMEAHTPLPVEGAHFDRWLEIFEQAARDLCPPAAAEAFIERAHRIAQSLELGIASHRGQFLRMRERLRA